MEPLLASQLQPFLHRPTYLLFGISCVENFRSSTFTTVSKLSASLIQRASLSPAFLTLTTAPVTSSLLISACSPIGKRRRLSQTSSACLCPPGHTSPSCNVGFVLPVWRHLAKRSQIAQNKEDRSPRRGRGRGRPPQEGRKEGRATAAAARTPRLFSLSQPPEMERCL